jgi:hypothetical protein
MARMHQPRLVNVTGGISRSEGHGTRIALYKAATVPQVAVTGSDLKSWLGDAGRPA